MVIDQTDKNLVSIYNNLDDLKNDFRNANLIHFLVPFVNGEKVLEIGCGNGMMLNALLAKNKQVTGLEASVNMIEIAKKLHPHLQILHGKAENADQIVSEKFDTILMVDVLEHIEDDVTMVKKINKLLKLNGEAVIFVPAYQWLYGQRDKNIGHFRRYSKNDLLSLFEKYGFELVYLRYWNMLGVLPYFLAEKIFCKSLNTQFRSGRSAGVLKKSISRLLFLWFAYIENIINFGFGLSLICVAKKIRED